MSATFLAVAIHTKNKAGGLHTLHLKDQVAVPPLSAEVEVGNDGIMHRVCLQRWSYSYNGDVSVQIFTLPVPTDLNC